MFSEGDLIIYGTKGIHRVLKITEPDIEDMLACEKYYVLQCLKKPENTVYAPVSSSKILMRKIMSEESALELLKKESSIGTITIENNKKREEAFRENIRSLDPASLIMVIKTLYKRKDERLNAGKKMTVTDTRFLEEAENLLYEELSVSLGKEFKGFPGFMDS